MVLDHFVVESPEEWAVSAYTDIANDVLLDHNLVRAIERSTSRSIPSTRFLSRSARSDGSRRLSTCATSPR